MKGVQKYIWICLISLSGVPLLNGQVSINTDGTLPNNSSILDVKSTEKGILVPRMTSVQRLAIVSPATGLLVFQTDVPSGFYYYTGSRWIGLADLGSVSACTDYDGNSYPTLTIGSQQWMAENLRVTHYLNGDDIPNISDTTLWSEDTVGACCWYNNDPDTYGVYGILYNWYAATDSRRICPPGWRIPSHMDWANLLMSLGGQSLAGGKLKSTSLVWTSPNSNATNPTGFSGIPGGYRLSNGAFYYAGYFGDWWTSTEVNTTDAWFWGLSYNNHDLEHCSDSKKDGFSVRCIRE